MAMQRTSRTVVVTVTVAHMALVVALTAYTLVISNDPLSDPLSSVTMAAIYGAPAMLALMALHDRRPLLAAAAVTALLLAVVPFSLHSFVLGPLGIIYLATYFTSSVPRTATGRTVSAVLLCPALVMTAFIGSLLHQDPLCYSQSSTGTVTYERPASMPTSGTLDPDTAVAEGCTSNAVVWWEATAGLAVTTAAITAASALTKSPGGRQEPRNPEHATVS